MKSIHGDAGSQLLRIFRQHGVTGAVREVCRGQDDEAIFIVNPVDAAYMRERELTVALKNQLGRRVWIATDQSHWKRTELL